MCRIRALPLPHVVGWGAMLRGLLSLAARPLAIPSLPSSASVTATSLFLSPFYLSTALPSLYLRRPSSIVLCHSTSHLATYRAIHTTPPSSTTASTTPVDERERFREPVASCCSSSQAALSRAVARRPVSSNQQSARELGGLRGPARLGDLESHATQSVDPPIYSNALSAAPISDTKRHPRYIQTSSSNAIFLVMVAYFFHRSDNVELTNKTASQQNFQSSNSTQNTSPGGDCFIFPQA